MELFNAEMRRLWKLWDLKVMVLLNLAMQLCLLFLGSRRKSTSKISLRVIVWCAYIAADSLAGVALGILSTKIGEQINDGDQSGALNDESNLIAFWAPSLLLLLGGPDTITAYSMEDNELWLRHLLGLVVQTSVTAYICLMAWNSTSYLSFLSLAMFVCAMIKYGERVWVLWQSSKEKRKDAILSPPYAGTNYPRFMEEYSVKQHEGYNVTVDEIVELPVPKKVPATNNIPDAEFLIKAHHLHQIVLRLFLDLVMTHEDREMSVIIFQEFRSCWENIFKVVEIELSFMYDLLHTKAMVLYSRWGVGRRLVTLAISSLSLIVFYLASRHANYDDTNLGATFLLLGVIVLMDLYSLTAMMSSDWTHVWLSNKENGRKFGLDRVVSLFSWSRPARWSNSVGQLSLLSFCTKRESVPCQSVLKRLHIQEKVETYYHTRHEKLLDTVKRAMVDYVDFLYKQPQKSRNDLNFCMREVLRRHIADDINDLEWSTEMEFDKCILVWHVATELCYRYYNMDRYEVVNRNVASQLLKEGHISYNLVAKILSHYMYYLLVSYPFMLPSGIGQIRVRDTCAEARKFFEERGLWSSTKNELELHVEACNLLQKVNTDVPPNIVKGERSKSVLFDGCRLASALIKKLEGKPYEQENPDGEIACRMMAEIWMEILAIAARQCSGESHTVQLKRGGELITFEWLLLAHFGLTDHFQMTKGRAIAKLILR